jgi:hypothetical protein
MKKEQPADEALSQHFLCWFCVLVLLTIEWYNKQDPKIADKKYQRN